MTKRKKGFTIVELVIVIAVIGILAGILIPLFTSLVRDAHIASDELLIRELNNALAIDTAETGKTHETIFDALGATDACGFNVQKINAKASRNRILWDSKNDTFCYLSDEDGLIYQNSAVREADKLSVGDYRLWAIQKTVDEVYSTYLYNYAGDGIITTSKGLDVSDASNNAISSITYEHTGAVQNVVIRTNSYNTVLTIDAEYDTVTHYGKAKNVDVDAVDNNNCYNEHGDVLGNINLKQGKVVVHEGCKAAAVVIDMTAAELASVTTLSADNSKEPTVPIILNTSQVLWNANPNNDLINPTTNNIIYTTMGGTLPENFENMTKEEKEVAIAAVEDVILGEAAIGSTSYETLAQAFSAVKTNETIVMLKDVTVSGSYLLVNNKNVTLDLSQHTLTSSLSYGFYVYSGSPKFTLKNGIVNSTDCIVYAKHNAEVFLDNVDITTTNDSSIYAHGSSVITVGSNAIVRSSTTGNYAATYIDENATINVYGKMIRTAGSGKGFAIVGNGTNGHLQNTTINIYDGAYIEASDTIAIYNPQRGTINVYGGKIEAYYSCIGIKSGSLNIFGGELKSTWNSEIERGSVPSSSSAGIDTNGSCIQIDSNTSYAGQMNVNITGGNFISEYAYIICETGNVNGSNVVSVRISNATATSHFENLILSTVASENLTNDASWTIVSVSE